LWHFQARLIRKILAHTVAVFLNLQLGRKPLDLDGLVFTNSDFDGDGKSDTSVFRPTVSGICATARL